MQTEPQNPLPLVYLITDHTDTNTYFVRAVMRDSLSGSIIQTINLTDRGNRRFSTQVNAPADPTGFGRHIDITITPYTDSGYTQKADTYQEKIDKWYIRAQQSHGGGGSDIDYDYLFKRVSDIFERKLNALEFPKTDLSNIYKYLGKIRDAIVSIEIPEVPEAEKLDLEPVLQALERVESALSGKIDGIDIPEQEKLDLAPVLEALQALETAFGKALTASVDKQTDAVTKASEKGIQTALKANQERMGKVKAILREFAEDEPDTEKPKEEKRHPLFNRPLP